MAIEKSNNQIKCKYCSFVKEDKSVSDGFWTAYECGNSESPYYRLLLNVDPHGNRLCRVTWHGCPFGERG